MNTKQIKHTECSYAIISYSFKELKEIFLIYSEINNEVLTKKLQNQYFSTYFQEIDAKTIILEKEYIDKDFLEDFSNYYVKCFYPYKKVCSRIHFFKEEFDEAKFKSLLINNDSSFKEKFQSSYLGFIVIKNLPKTIIGKTCLKTYETESTGRFFPTTRVYKANLFGIPLKIETLAFQEQDTVVAACATSSLWSVFHGTGKLFQHSIPSPYEITKSATENFPTRTRAFPNNGLNLEMMAKAIKNIGLEPLFVDTNNIVITKAAIYAYLRAKIPLLMAFKLFKNHNYSFRGGHAVAVGGYHLDENKDFIPYSPPGEINQILLKSSKIDKIYAHDDQVGPFARMEFNKSFPVINEKGELCLNEKQEPIIGGAISTSFEIESGKETCVALPDALLVPTYHKIRVPFQTILDEVYKFDSWLEDFKNVHPNILSFLPKIEWDIYLTTVNDLKIRIRDDSNISENYKHNLLTQNYPRFIWSVTAYKQNKKTVEILFDATDIEQNEFAIDIIKYDQESFHLLKAISQSIYEGIKPEPINSVIINKLISLTS